MIQHLLRAGKVGPSDAERRRREVEAITEDDAKADAGRAEAARKRGEEIAEELDELLDEIDAVLDDPQLAVNYVQKGGQ